MSHLLRMYSSLLSVRCVSKIATKHRFSSLEPAKAGTSIGRHTESLANFDSFNVSGLGPTRRISWKTYHMEVLLYTCSVIKLQI